MRFRKFCAALTISALLAAPSFCFANTTEAADTGDTVTATKLQLTLGSNTALLNDVPYQLEIPPEIVEGVSFLPIRFVTEQALGAAVQWDPATNLVQITRGEAQIKIDLANGQALVNEQEVELSSPPFVKDGRTLVPLRFLAENFNVQVDYDPVLKTITIIDQTAAEEETVNLPPVITSLGLQSTVLKIGEEAKYNCPYDNEAGEGITAQEWRCQMTGSDQIVSGQPRAFFRPGEYLLSLRIQDAAGNWSSVETTSFTVSDEVLMNEMAFKFSKPIYGELFENFDNFNFFSLKANDNVTFEHSGPVLHMSNSPEVVYQPGTLYRSEASGNFRFFFHHLNGAAERQYLYVIAENNNPYPVTLQAKKSGVGGPVTDYMNLGQLTAMRYLASQQSAATTIKPGAKLILNQGMRFLNKGEAVTGMQDYQVDGAITISVVMGPEKAPQPEPEPITDLDSLLSSATIPDPADAVVTGDTARDNALILDLDVGQSGQAKDTDSAEPPISETLSETAGKFDAAERGTDNDSISTPPPAKTPEQLLAEKIDYLLALPVLPRSPKQVRGVFPGADCLVNIQVDGGTSEKVRLGIEEPGFDSWVEGVDPLTGETIKSVGNYGVVYRVKVTAPKKTGVMLNPRGSIFKAAIQSFNGQVYKAPETGFFTGAQKAAVLGVLAAGQTKEFTYTPSSGSDTPLLIALIPEKEWDSLD